MDNEFLNGLILSYNKILKEFKIIKDELNSIKLEIQSLSKERNLLIENESLKNKQIEKKKKADNLIPLDLSVNPINNNLKNEVSTFKKLYLCNNGSVNPDSSIEKIKEDMKSVKRNLKTRQYGKKSSIYDSTSVNVKKKIKSKKEKPTCAKVVSSLQYRKRPRKSAVKISNLSKKSNVEFFLDLGNDLFN